ncbi:MAG: DUF6790 family protein [Ilumatobacteraceae bacterium]
MKTTTPTTSTPHPAATAPPRTQRHLVSGILPWLGVILFVTHAASLVTQQPGGWQQQIVQIGIVYLIGVACLGAGIAHLFVGAKIARSIGWAPSPFQWEVGCADTAFGLVALQAAAFGPQYWLAIIAVNGIFRIGCGIGHIREIITAGNYAINNTAILFNNFVVPAFLYLAWHAWA